MFGIWLGRRAGLRNKDGVNEVKRTSTGTKDLKTRIEELRRPAKADFMRVYRTDAVLIQRKMEEVKDSTAPQQV
ncbi:hypothetical protein HJFPF1_11147 [Paramyrothecium foliicola]|nr:hypothetical protein HJFPF1_11147 [Paramyrothecium foliicola]